MTYQYLFTLGHQPELSQAEIFSVLTSFHISYIDAEKKNNSLLLTTEEVIPSDKIMERLGGTQRIAQRIDAPMGTVPEKIFWYLHEYLTEGKIRFGLSGVSDKVGIQVKKELKRVGKSVRYVSIKNMASIVHNNLVERRGHITIFDNQLYVTEAVHDFEDTAVRDYERPAVDAYSGMLPPKLARMMINLAEVGEESTILDPFCGSGTVLMEASLYPFARLYGSDISDKAIADTEENMHWMRDRYGKIPAFELKQLDVKKLSSWISAKSIDAIVSEPYMGKPKHGNESLSFLQKEINDLQQLFDTMLGQFAQVLKDDGVVIFTKPRFAYQGNWQVIDWEASLAAHGFEAVPFFTGERFLLYARAEQHVGREVWRLRKKK